MKTFILNALIGVFNLITQVDNTCFGNVDISTGEAVSVGRCGASSGLSRRQPKLWLMLCIENYLSFWLF